MLMTIFCIVLGVLFIVACLIGVIALYFALKQWVSDNLDIELPPHAETDSSYWETDLSKTEPVVYCKSCNYDSDKKYWYCPHCGKHMDNYRM